MNKSELVDDANELINEIDKKERIGKLQITKEYIIDNLQDTKFIESVEACYKTLSFLENRYQNYSQVMIILISAVIGGVLGGLLSKKLK